MLAGHTCYLNTAQRVFLRPMAHFFYYLRSTAAKEPSPCTWRAMTARVFPLSSSAAGAGYFCRTKQFLGGTIKKHPPFSRREAMRGDRAAGGSGCTHSFLWMLFAAITRRLVLTGFGTPCAGFCIRAATGAAAAAGGPAPDEAPDKICCRGGDNDDNDHGLHGFLRQRPYFSKSVPVWYTAAARANASAVLNTMENAPHFHEPASRAMHTTVTKQGA